MRIGSAGPPRSAVRGLHAQPRNRRQAAGVLAVHPAVIIGLFIGGPVPHLFGAMAMRPARRARSSSRCGASSRRSRVSWKARPPDYSKAVDMRARRDQGNDPAVAAADPDPVIVGFGMSWLSGARGHPRAGGADRHDRDGAFVGTRCARAAARGTTRRSTSRKDTTAQGLDTHKAAVTGDTVGDP